MWTARAIAANQEANAVFREDVPAKGWTAGSPTRWSPESFAREQLRGLVRQVFSVTAALPVRQMVFSPGGPEVELAGLCLQDAQTLSEETLKDVALATAARFPADVCTLPLKQLANQVQRHLWLFKAGDCGGNRNSKLSGFAFLAELRAQFQYSIVATAAVCDSAAAIETAQFSDGVVLVISAQSTKRVAALKAKRLLEEARARVLGTILVDREFPIPESLYRRL
jgi:hypothetical protein